MRAAGFGKLTPDFMKTKHRRELKENDFARLIRETSEWVQPRTSQITAVIVGLIVVAVAVFGFSTWRNREQNQGQDLLAQAMVVLNTAVVPVTATTQPGEAPAAASIGATGTFSTEEQKLNSAIPKLRAAADTYPDAQAGITARYHLASSLAALGKEKDAIAQYDEVMKHAGADSLYGRMAQMGKADAQTENGDVDAAIASWQALQAKKDSNIPQDAILMQLARAYQTKGDAAKARDTFNNIVTNFPDSPYVADARKGLDSLKG
jgi:predicted negative regulator of RcsB-dependent stress response